MYEQWYWEIEECDAIKNFDFAMTLTVFWWMSLALLGAQDFRIKKNKKIERERERERERKEEEVNKSRQLGNWVMATYGRHLSDNMDNSLGRQILLNHYQHMKMHFNLIFNIF